MPEQGTPPNSDEQLKGILGFDPESGERIEERTGLKPIDRSELLVPPETQTAFTNYISFTENLRKGIKEYRETKTKILPERLAYILQDVKHEYGTRTYYSWIHSVEGEIHFRQLTSANIGKLYKAGRLMSVEHLGEATDRMLESARINFESQSTTCTFHLANRLFWVDFREEYLSLIFVFGNDRYGNVILEDDEYVGPKEAKTFTETLTKRGSLESSEGLSEYELTADKEVVKLKRIKNEIVGDELSIPRKINQEEIIRTLFDPLTLEDPFNAPPELDDSWRFTNLMEVVGIKWERY